jgi:hypothetical protein
VGLVILGTFVMALGIEVGTTAIALALFTEGWVSDRRRASVG